MASIMGKTDINHSRYCCLLRLGKTSDQSKKLLKLTNKMIEAFNGFPVNTPQLTIDIDSSSVVKNGKYAAYLTNDDKVILINRQQVYFVDKLDGDLKVSV